MKKHAKKKGGAKASATKKVGARAKKPAATRSAGKAAPTAAGGPASTYTPAPIKGDGWPPFRYPLQ
jgi:hypothetical protein